MGTPDLNVSSAMRPIRTVVFVPLIDGVEWQHIFTGALRAQVRVWGGQSNFPVPLNDDSLDHTVLWALLRALDPDAVIVHRTTWADLEDLRGDLYQDHRERTRAELEERGFPEQVIANHLEELPGQALTGRQLSDEEATRLLERGPFLAHGNHPMTGYTGGSGGAGFPFVDALALRRDLLPNPMASVTCPSSPDGQLGLAADGGQFSPTAERELAKRKIVVGEARELDGDFELATYLHAVVRTAGPALPFALAGVGLSWYSQGYSEDTTIRLVVGDDPWDFALFYALRRLTGVAYWIPPDRIENDVWIHELAHLSDRLNFGSDAQLRVSSVSNPGHAEALVRRLRDIPGPGHSVEGVAWDSLLPDLPRRHLCAESVSFPQRLALDPTGASAAAFPTPVPEIRGERDPFDMHWIVDLYVDGWTGVTRPQLAAAVLDMPGGDPGSGRTSSDGLSYLNPRAFVTPNERLEGQVRRPRLRTPSVIEQIDALIAGSGWRCQLSDKGIYRDQTAELLGGLDKLAQALLSRPWHELLLSLTSAKQSGQPGRWLKSEKRRVFDLGALDQLIRELQIEETPAGLVRRGVLRRGLLHKCPRCRWDGWYGEDELGRELRCGRCRRAIRLGETGWVGEGEPQWFYRVDEVIWQFCEHNGQLPLRAAKTLLWTDRPTTLIGPELDLFRPGKKRPIEVDLCVVRGGRLWIGEAKTTAALGASESDARNKLRRLRDVANALQADGVLVVSEVGFNTGTQQIIDEVLPSHERFVVRVETCPPPT
jgi:hypothetical protein